MVLTAGQKAAYGRDGYLLVQGLVTGDELAALRAAADRVMAEAVAYGRELDAQGAVRLREQHGFSDWDAIDDRRFLYAADAEGRRVWRRAEGMWDRDTAFRRVTAHPGLLDVAYGLGGEDVVAGNDSLVVKMPGGGAAVPWHRDPTGVMLLEGGGDAATDFTCDLYLDSSTIANGAVWAVPGSHRDLSLPGDALAFPLDGAVPLEAEPGDLLVHSTGVLHGSPPNESGSLRRTFYVHFPVPSTMTDGWWQRSPEWAEGQRKLLADMAAERASAGL